MAGTIEIGELISFRLLSQVMRAQPSDTHGASPKPTLGNTNLEHG
jgi:hypothetical protein